MSLVSSDQYTLERLHPCRPTTLGYSTLRSRPVSRFVMCLSAIQQASLKPSYSLLVYPVSPTSTVFLGRWTHTIHSLRHYCFLWSIVHNSKDTSSRSTTLPGKETRSIENKTSFSTYQCHQHICFVLWDFWRFICYRDLSFQDSIPNNN